MQNKQNAVIKTAVHMIIAGYAAKTAKTQLTGRTNVNPDSILLDGGMFLVGETVAGASDQYTAKVIDYSVSKVKTFFKNRKNKTPE